MNFKPLGDMILVKPDLIDDKIGSIFIPQGILKAGDQPGDWEDGFIGTVVATGPGDQLVVLECTRCRKHRTRMVVKTMRRSGVSAKRDESVDGEDVAPQSRGSMFAGITVGRCACGETRSTLVAQGHAEMQTKVGDRVVFPRRPTSPGGEFNITLEGVKYIMLHEQQFALAVITA